MTEFTSDARVFVAGHTGLVGSAIVRRLEREGITNLALATRSEVDLTDASAVDAFFAAFQPTFVFLAAARVGGIAANDRYPGDFIRDNLAIQLNVLDAARRHGVAKLLFLGSSCIYPVHAAQPIAEDALLTGPLEPTNRAYAVAKIAGIEMCRAYRKQYASNFIAVMPTNLYGPGDNFDLETSHVLPAMLRRFHEAREAGASSVTLWGTGTPRREFLHVDDLADACLHLMRVWDGAEIVNVGTGSDLTIAELAEMVRDAVGYDGRIVFDTSRPDGTPRKVLDVTRVRGLGWRPTIGLREGIERTYRWFREHVAASDPRHA